MRTLEIERGGLKALEWSINEIMDNALSHSRSNHGGMVQASSRTDSKIVEFVVADAGIGIPASLDIHDHELALQRAIEEGVTSNKETNQGNGLFGTYQVANAASGRFSIVSHQAWLTSTEGDLKSDSTKPAFFPSTAVIVSFDCSNSKALENALRINGEKHTSGFDYIDRLSENGDGEKIIIRMRSEFQSFGNREPAKIPYTKIYNLINDDEIAQVELDFSDVFVVSSSFADEVFGKLVRAVGPMTFMNKVKFSNTDRTVMKIIDRAIVKRMSGD
jgi:hypothetical protein